MIRIDTQRCNNEAEIEMRSVSKKRACDVNRVRV